VLIGVFFTCRLHADTVMMLEDMFACISSETEEIWTKLNTLTAGSGKGEPVKFPAESHQWPGTVGMKNIIFVRCTNHRFGYLLFADFHQTMQEYVNVRDIELRQSRILNSSR